VTQAHRAQRPKSRTRLVSLYRQSPDVGVLLELMTDFDEGIQEWRLNKPPRPRWSSAPSATSRAPGGSLGVELPEDHALQSALFPDLWAISEPAVTPGSAKTAMIYDLSPPISPAPQGLAGRHGSACRARCCST